MSKGMIEGVGEENIFDTMILYCSIPKMHTMVDKLFYILLYILLYVMLADLE